MSVAFVSGHLDLTQAEFDLHYVHLLDEALAISARFVIGDARGADTLAQDYLASRGAGTVYHLFEAPRNNIGGWPVSGGYRSDDERDAAMTAASTRDIAWVRPGRARSGTARNLARRALDPARVQIASGADWRRVRSLRLTALADAPDAFGSTFAEESARRETLWQERLAGPATTLLARAGGLDWGLAVVAPTDDDASSAGLYSVFVAQAARGRGVGDALIASAIALARSRGYRRLLLDVGDHNAPAIALYARHGFAPTGRKGSLPPPRTHVLEHEMAVTLAP